MTLKLPFNRVVELNNDLAFELNKATAVQLIMAFPEIHDLNPENLNAHFTRQGLDDLDNESTSAAADAPSTTD